MAIVEGGDHLEIFKTTSKFLFISRFPLKLKYNIYNQYKAIQYKNIVIMILMIQEQMLEDYFVPVTHPVTSWRRHMHGAPWCHVYLLMSEGTLRICDAIMIRPRIIPWRQLIVLSTNPLLILRRIQMKSHVAVTWHNYAPATRHPGSRCTVCRASWNKTCRTIMTQIIVLLLTNTLLALR